MSIPYLGAPSAMINQASDFVPVTPSDANPLGYKANGLYIGNTAGNVVVVTEAGTERTIPVAANSILPLGVTHVKATGTTATLIFAIRVG